jgi:hypothetical protein
VGPEFETLIGADELDEALEGCCRGQRVTRWDGFVSLRVASFCPEVDGWVCLNVGRAKVGVIIVVVSSRSSNIVTLMEGRRNLPLEGGGTVVPYSPWCRVNSQRLSSMVIGSGPSGRCRVRLACYISRSMEKGKGDASYYGSVRAVWCWDDVTNQCPIK